MKRFIPVLVAVAALAAPAGAFASTGIVLKVEHGAHLIAVTRGTHVQLVHTSRNGLAVGQRVSMRAQRLRNGTFSAAAVKVVGRSRRVEFRGLLISRSRASHRMTLSAGGAIVTVKAKDQPKAQPGSEVEVKADVSDDGDLEDGQTSVVAPTAPGGSIEGHLVAIGAGTITVGSDEQLLVISVPAGSIDLTKFALGDEVLAQFSQAADGSLLLTSLSSDDNATDANGQQGDGNDGNGGGGGGGDGGHDGGGHDGGGDGSDG